MSIAIHQSLPAQKIGKCLAKCYPMWGKGEPVLFRAENGLIVCIDNRTTTPRDRRRKVVSRQEMFARLKVWTKMIVQQDEDPRWAFERNRANRFVDEMINVLKEAKHQGGPYDGMKPLPPNPNEISRQMRAPVMASGDRHLEYIGKSGKPLSLIPRAACDLK